MRHYTMKRAIIIFSMSILLCNSVISARSNYTNLSDKEVSNRIDEIESTLTAGEKPAKLWWDAWLIGYLTLGTGQLVGYFVTPEDTAENIVFREEMLVGSITTYLGAVGNIVDPMVPAFAAHRIHELPGKTPEERRLKLIEAENYFQASAMREINGRSFAAHGIGIGVSLAGAAVLYFAMAHTLESALLNFGIGVVITEIQIFTQPMKAVSDWDKYAKKHGIDKRISYNKDEQQNWFLHMGLGQFVAGTRF